MSSTYVELQKGCIVLSIGIVPISRASRYPCKTFDIFAQVDHCSKHTSAIPLLNYYNHLQ